MAFALHYTLTAKEQLDELHQDKMSKQRLKAVVKALQFLEQDPHHPRLHTHKYTSIVGPDGTEVFEAHAQNNTAAARSNRIFWCYHQPRRKGERIASITILAITPHP